MAGDELSFGFSVSDVEKMAGSAATRHNRTWLTWQERRTVALDGILDLLYDSSSRPTGGQLASAGHG